jgi:purine-binding chemotaxis protein CheW
MASLFLIAHINGARVAIESERIESIVHVQEVISVPKCDPSIAGLFALRSRVLTLIDSQYLVTGEKQIVHQGALAVVAEISGHHFGLLVDAVEDVVSISDDQIESHIKPAKNWEQLISATALVDGGMVMILDPSRLINGEEALAA